MKMSIFLAAVASVGLAVPALATISAGPTINGVQTFTDSNTGRNWARMDTYFNRSHNDMAADIGSKGFTVANFTQVDELLDSLPLDAGQWTSYAAIMGRAPNRELIWGSFAPVNNAGNIDWAFAANGDRNWTSFNFAFPAATIPSAGSRVADMNIWAFTDGGTGAVPEPSSWAMLIAGFGLVGAVSRRRRPVAA